MVEDYERLTPAQSESTQVPYSTLSVLIAFGWRPAEQKYECDSEPTTSADQCEAPYPVKPPPATKASEEEELPRFRITHEDHGDIVVIRIPGRLDRHTYEEIEYHISRFLRAHRHWLIVDLSDVTFINSRNAAILMGARSEAREHGGELVVLKPSEVVRYVFD